MTDTNNHETMRASVFAEIENLGSISGAAADGLTRLAFRIHAACVDKLFTESDVKPAYLAYVKAHNTRASSENAKPTDDKSIKSHVSTLGTFAKPAVVWQGHGFYDRIRMLQNEVPAERKMSLYNACAKANRATVKLSEDEGTKSRPDDKLLLSVIMKPVQPIKGDIEKLMAHIKAMGKLAENLPGLDTHLSALRDFAKRLADGNVEGESELIKGEGEGE